MSDRLLSFFYSFQFNQAYWDQSETERQVFRQNMLAGLDASKICYYLYQVFPLHAEIDLLLWLSAPLSEENPPDRFFEQAAGLLNPLRRVVTPRMVWWGMTRQSDYARGKSAQEIDVFDGQRSKYLVVYPFTKTVEWYRMGRDTRQGMMNEHIRVGHQYPQIKQLLLYSTGLQDQEFIVTYETDDLGQFSTLVADLRGSEARRFTERDTPVVTAIYRSPQETLNLFA